MTDAVLVTGAFGLVGSSTVKRLAADGRRVVATDLDIPANRKAAEQAAARRRGALRRPHRPRRGRRAGRGASRRARSSTWPRSSRRSSTRGRRSPRRSTSAPRRSLLAAAAKQPSPPRFVQASSIAVYGARNPHTHPDVLTADTPLNPADVYGAHKAAAEKLVRASSLDWVILRLGGVLTVDPAAYMKLDNLYFEGLLPVDGRLQTVDVRDVARAFAAATTADAVGETLLDRRRRHPPTDPGRRRPRHGRGDGPRRRPAHRAQGQPGQRRRLVQHRLDGHRARAGSAWPPTSFVARDADRDRQQGRRPGATCCASPHR